MFLNQGTSQPEASQEKVNGDMAEAWEELELDDMQLASVVGGVGVSVSPRDRELAILLEEVLTEETTLSLTQQKQLSVSAVSALSPEDDAAYTKLAVTLDTEYGLFLTLQGG